DHVGLRARRAAPVVAEKRSDPIRRYRTRRLVGVAARRRAAADNRAGDQPQLLARWLAAGLRRRTRHLGGGGGWIQRSARGRHAPLVLLASADGAVLVARRIDDRVLPSRPGTKRRFL